ncbi:MAG: hypothetical protein ACXADY_07880 [Candidatus Hodarchaeales archaeon]
MGFNGRKGLFGLGIVFVLFATFMYLILLYELISFEIRPWPYADGTGWETFMLYKSLFLIQRINHCQYLYLTLYGLLFWKCWGSLLGIGVGLLVKLGTNFKSTNKVVPPHKDKFSIFGSIGVLIANCTLYLAYALDYQLLYSSGPYFPLLDFFWSRDYIFWFVLIPTFVFYVAYRGISSKDVRYLIGLPFLVIFDFFLTILFLGWTIGC